MSEADETLIIPPNPELEPSGAGNAAALARSRPVHPPVSTFDIDRRIEDRVFIAMIKAGAVLGLIAIEAIVLVAVAHALGVHF